MKTNLQKELSKVLKTHFSDHKQKRSRIVGWAQSLAPYPKISKDARMFLDKKIICDLFEGNAPLTPRYILPDYKLFLSQGSEYLNLPPAKDLYQAINSLLILYQYVPSVTGYPVYLGNIDTLLEPYISATNSNSISENEIYNLLKLYLTNIDRTLSNAFVHLNIGPTKTIIGEQILKIEKELKNSVPNLSLKIDEHTDRSFILTAIDTALTTAKPYFVNHTILSKELPFEYGVASCYNTLQVGGGSHTLVRVNLKAVAEEYASSTHTTHATHAPHAQFETLLTKVLNAQVEIINARARFLIEEINFFNDSFLAREKLINLDKFTSMAGIFGLYECIEILSDGGLKLGQDLVAEEYAMEILKIIHQTLKANKIGFHAQSGIDSDTDTTPGVRIKTSSSSSSLSLSKQLKIAGTLHQYFDTGVSDIVVFDQTSHKNHQGVLTIIEGALKAGVKVLSINAVDSELIRVSGYLIKRSDLKKYQEGIPLRDESVALGANSIQRQNILGRKQFPIANKDY
ncbi:MAG: YjjI family glycine radical enzyme [Oligoflexia bacterium]|nr:YjjI family glycine radical enzyme [Oligoflexia bacterium]